MTHSDLPERWRLKIKEYLIAKGDKERNKLNIGDFSLNQKVQIRFDDDSFAEFRYPLVIKAPELLEVGVFTEHCGYHIFSSVDTSITILER